MRRRLALTIAGVATGAVLLFAIPLAAVLHRTYRDEEMLRLQRDTVAATREIDVAPSTADPVELPASGDALTVYDVAGHRVTGPGPVIADPLVARALRSSRPLTGGEGGLLAAAIPLLSNERVTGAVLATRDDSRVDRDTRRAWLALGGLAFVLISLAAAVALVLGRRLSAPMERLASAAGRLGSGDFSVRTSRSGVHEIDDIGTALDASAGRLEELITRERSFSADASHQLRTPLAALRIELEAMELRGAQDEELRAALTQVDRLQATIDTLLSVARDVPAGDTVADLVVLADEAMERWRGRLAERGRPLRSRLETASAQIRAQPSVVREILDVLLDNAAKHGAGAVNLTIRPLDGWFAIDVQDEGPGFRGDPDRAFLRRTGSGSGHGIGLSLARALAHAEGGRLSVTRPAPRPVLTLLLRSASWAERPVQG
jgi:signal transduction histidine kinase